LACAHVTVQKRLYRADYANPIDFSHLDVEKVVR
jgi:hypothetical protein